MKNKYNRREFLKTASSALAGILYIASPVPTLASTYNNEINSFRHDSEKTLLARMIYGEARELLKKEDQKEAIMIGFTAINRAKDRIKENGESIKESILKKSQYSCFNPRDPNLKKLKNPEKYDPSSWEKALKLSDKLLEGKLTHLNYGQDHYYRKNTPTPYWANSPRMEKIWGQPSFKHEFYKDTKA